MALCLGILTLRLLLGFMDHEDWYVRGKTLLMWKFDVWMPGSFCIVCGCLFMEGQCGKCILFAIYRFFVKVHSRIRRQGIWQVLVSVNILQQNANLILSFYLWFWLVCWFQFVVANMMIIIAGKLNDVLLLIFSSRVPAVLSETF